MVPDERDAADEGKPDRREDPKRELSPMPVLHAAERGAIEQLPRGKDVDLVGPNRADVVERQCEIQHQERRRTHDSATPARAR